MTAFYKDASQYFHPYYFTPIKFIILDLIGIVHNLSELSKYFSSKSPLKYFINILFNAFFSFTDRISTPTLQLRFIRFYLSD